MFDSPLERHQGRKKSPLTWWLVLTTVFVVFGLAYYVTFGPNPPIRLGKATTHITAPLAEDGLPDYAAALLAEMRKGTTPENNGAVLFLQAMWPREGDEYMSIPAEAGKRLCQELGREGPPPPDERATPLDTPARRLQIVSLLRKRLRASTPPEKRSTNAMELLDPLTDADFLAGPAADVADNGRVDQVLYGCEPIGRPWRRVDLPFVAEWLDENQRQLDAVVEAVERPQWYLPNHEWLRGGRGAMTSMSMELVQLYRDVARRLNTLCTLDHGEQRFAAAARDALAIRRLAKHAGTVPLYIDQLVANAIDGIGLTVIDQLASDPKTPLPVLRTLLAETPTGEIACDMGWAAGMGERYFFLDSFLVEPQGVDKEWGTQIGWLSWTRIDWNDALLAANQQFDKIRKASTTQPWTSRRDAIAAIDLQVQAFATDGNSIARPSLRYALPAIRSERVAEHVSAAVASLVSMVFAAEDTNRARVELTRVGIALAIHLAGRGSYPETLDELVPSILPKAPVDPLHRLPLGYRRTDDGFLLYAIGPNGIDDGGSNAGLEGGGYSRKTYQGIDVEKLIDEPSDTLTAEEQAAFDLLEKIPDGADDLSLRLPLPVEPWPWEAE